MEGVIPGRQRLSEEIHAIGNGRGELQDQTGHRQAIPLVQLQTQALDVDVLEHVVLPGTVEHVLPIGVAIGAREDPEILGPKGDGGAVAIRVVEAESTLEHLPVRIHLGQGTRESRISDATAGELGPPVADHAQGSGLDDPVDEGLAAGAAQEAGLVVEGVGREERVA